MKILLSKFKRKPKTGSEIWKDSAYVINFSFSSGGVDYYCFEDSTNIPYERAFTTMDFFNEVSMNVDIEYLKLHTKAIKNILSKTTINVFDINKLNEQLNEKITMIRSPDLIMKLASVIYFDKNESPIKYDFIYNQKKIARWNKEFPDGSFFLSKPISVLLPSLNESPENLKNYRELFQKVDSLHLEEVLSLLYENNNNKEMIEISK